MTGIPSERMTESDVQRMKMLDKILKEKVIGQNEAIDLISSCIRRSRAGISSKDRPIGSFLFLGPTGVGKTLLAKTLLNLGRKHAIVAHGMDGMDEISLCDETLIHEVKDGRILEYKITPEQFGFTRAFHKDIEGGSAHENADVIRATLRGEISGAKFDIVVLNAMFALYCAVVGGITVVLTLLR